MPRGRRSEGCGESSLHCTERLLDSPSTSAASLSMNRRRSLPLRSVPLQQLCQNRKRPSSESRLNNAQHAFVRPTTDAKIQGDSRALHALLQMEDDHCVVNPQYLEGTQIELTAANRSLVVEWLRDVLREEEADPEVLPLAVLLLDLFLSRQSVFRRDIQAAASACLLIASKLKAPIPLTASRISYYTDNSVPTAQMMSWELLVLKRLSWGVSLPTAFDFADLLQSRQPALAILRTHFTDEVHAIQLRMAEASLPPSLQASLALLSAAHCSRSLPLIFLTRDVISTHLGYNPVSLEVMLMASQEGSSAVPGCVPSLSPVDTPPPSASLAWSTHRSVSPPSTPNGSDSGFSSATASPDSTGRPLPLSSSSTSFSPKLPRLMERQSL